jgi:hypothetical protein
MKKLTEDQKQELREEMQKVSIGKLAESARKADKKELKLKIFTRIGLFAALAFLSISALLMLFLFCSGIVLLIMQVTGGIGGLVLLAFFVATIYAIVYIVRFLMEGRKRYKGGLQQWHSNREESKAARGIQW